MTLKDQINADFANVFMNTNDFAEGFTFSRTASTINGIFDNEFAVIIDNVETTKPALEVATSTIPGILHGDTFTRLSDSVVYKVIGIQPDGTGMTVAVLSQD